jgi:hypothetical protein
MHLKPVSGRQVPDPDRGGFLPPEGRTCEPHQYWLRRLQDGDVVEVKPEPKLTPKPKKGDEQ